MIPASVVFGTPVQCCKHCETFECNGTCSGARAERGIVKLVDSQIDKMCRDQPRQTDEKGGLRKWFFSDAVTARNELTAQPDL